jgi:PAS domain S-box-containing protein
MTLPSGWSRQSMHPSAAVCQGDGAALQNRVDPQELSPLAVPEAEAPASLVAGDDLIFNTADPVFAVDQDLRIIIWNHAAAALLGFQPEEVLGRHCYELVGCRDDSGRIACHGNCLELLRGRRQELVPTHDFLLRTRHGRKIWVSVSTILMPSTRKDLSVLVHLFRDASRQKEMERFIGHLVSHAAKLSMTPGADPPESPGGSSPPPALTGREREVLRLIAAGASTRAAAAKLSVSLATARNHIHNTLTKLEVHSRLEAVTLAMRRGLI